MAARPKLTLYLDVVSPFAYMAFYVTEHSPVFRACDITYVPIFLGGVMKACGNRPPIQIKNKDKWIELDRQRWAAHCNIPITHSMPEGFPPVTLNLMRTLCAIEQSQPEQLVNAFTACYDAMWVRGEAVHTPEVYAPLLKKVLGVESAEGVLKAASTPETKAKLTSNTDACLASGAFGLPWFVATNASGDTQAYWGFDHLGQVIAHLGLDRGKAGELRALL